MASSRTNGVVEPSPPSSPRMQKKSPLLMKKVVCCGAVSFLIGIALGNLSSFQEHHLNSVLLGTSTASTEAVAVAKAAAAGTLPDWRMTTDCSVYSRDCVMRKIREGKPLYAQYPFRFAQEYDALYNWQDKLPEGWKESLVIHVPSAKDNMLEKDKLKSDDPAIQKCVQKALKLTVDEQLDALLEKTLKRVNNMVSFTISDYLYAQDMMQDVFEMAHEVVGFNDAFFMVAMDVSTMELACQYNYPFLAWPQQEKKKKQKGEPAELKKNVANTKFDISYELIKRRQDFFFFEMDVWFVRSPLPVIREQTEDILFSGHQNNPEAANIGVYSVFANERSEEYLKICIEILQQSPDTHDQAVMQQVYWFLDALKAGRPLEYAGFIQEPKPKIPTFQHPATHGRFAPYLIPADERPVTTEKTLAIHTLCGAPLRNPHGKKMVAKELGAWYGSGNYYHGKDNRYLWVDGHSWNGISIAMSWPGFNPWALYHRFAAIQWIVAATVALARRTGRIWVMPKVLYDAGIHFLWVMLDFSSVEDLVQVRETNFPVNHKAWYSPTEPYKSVARTALGFQNKIMVQPDAISTTNGNNILAFNSTTFENQSPFDAWFALHTTMPELVDAQLLLAGLPMTSGEFLAFAHKARSTDRKDLSTAEKEIVDVYNQLKWCEVGRELERVVGRAVADWDCYLKGKLPA